MDCVAAQIRTQADCLNMATDDVDPECLSMDWVEIEIEICLDSGCCEHAMDLGTPQVTALSPQSRLEASDN